MYMAHNFEKSRVLFRKLVLEKNSVWCV